MLQYKGLRNPLNTYITAEHLTAIFSNFPHNIFPNQPANQDRTNMSSQILASASKSLLDWGYPKHHTPRYELDDLVADIKTHLGDSSGIGSEDIDAEHLISLAQKYISDPADWLRFFYNDTSKNYTRNAIENINRKANIVCPAPSSSWAPIANAASIIAPLSLEPRQGITDPRPCQCALYHEGPGWGTPGNRLLYPLFVVIIVGGRRAPATQDKILEHPPRERSHLHLRRDRPASRP